MFLGAFQVRVEYENGFIIERTRKRGRSESLRTFQRDFSSAMPVYQEQNELGELRNTQKLINGKLGIDFDTFSRSVVLGQNIFANFISGGKEQRRSIVEEMLGLDKFNLFFDIAKQRRQAVDALMADLDTDRANTERQLQEATTVLAALNSKIGSEFLYLLFRTHNDLSPQRVLQRLAARRFGVATS